MTNHQRMNPQDFENVKDIIMHALGQAFPKWNVCIINAEFLRRSSAVVLLIELYEPEKRLAVTETILSHWPEDEIVMHFKKILFKEEYLL